MSKDIKTFSFKGFEKREYVRKRALIEKAAQFLKIQSYELIITELKLSAKKDFITFNKSEKYKIEIGAKVEVTFKEQTIQTTVKKLDTDLKLLKVEEFKELPFSFDNVKFLETIKIK